jgi:hypothetical protein
VNPTSPTEMEEIKKRWSMASGLGGVAMHHSFYSGLSVSGPGDNDSCAF